MVSTTRQYDIIVFGATGYTGKYTSEHIVQNLPIDLKWAIAGRSTSKLQTLANELKALNPDRTPPGIEESSLDPSQLSALARKTRIFLNTVGPFAKYGTPVVEACIDNGTHYFDITGETPWVVEIVQKFHEKAKAKGVIVIPQIGVDSAPADLTAWSLVTHFRQTLGAPTEDVNFTIHKMKSLPSGGTLASVFNIFEQYGVAAVGKAMKPWSLSPIKPFPSKSNASLLQLITGVKVVSDLGTLTTSLQGPVDRTQVYRSWGLIEGGEYYGKTFRFHPFMTVRNIFLGFMMHFGIAFGSLMLALPPVRWLLKRMVYQPGEGAAKEETTADRVEYRAIGTAATDDPTNPKRAFARFIYEGSMYHMTGVFLAEAGMSLLHDDSLAKKMGGGVLTPATLGANYVDRLTKHGFKVDVRNLQ